MRVELSVIIVSWNVKNLLERCLASVLAQLPDIPGASEVLVIDNASSDGSAGLVQEKFPQVHLIANPSNAGFTIACNQGIAGSSGRYVLLLNPDTELQPGALPLMVDYLREHPEVALLGPQLLNPEGSVQSSRRRFPSLATALVESTPIQWRLFPELPLLRHFSYLDLPEGEVQEVDWVTGACLLIRRETLSQIGLLDERYFMYFEELDWCLRAKRAGWKIMYLPTAKVVHHAGKSSEQDLARRHIRFNDSKCKYYTKHYGPLVGLLLRVYLFSWYVVQAGEAALQYLFGRQRTLRREQLRMLLQVVRSGLRG